MPRAGLICLPLLLLTLSAAHGAATATPADSHAGQPVAAVPVTLGESSVELNGPWKFRTGDDMAWAKPDLDDSAWDGMDLTVNPDVPPPGWTKLGYPNYSGFAWYRIRVDVRGAKHRLSLMMPDEADDAYQVFVNGEEIGEFGHFTAHHVTAYPTLPEAFPLPRSLKDGQITIAIRMWMDSATRFNSPDAGGLHGPPTLGYASLMANLVSLDYDETAQVLGGAFLETLILFMALLMTWTLFWLDPEENGYLWLGVVCLVTLLGSVIVLSVNFKAWLGQTQAVVINDVLLTPARIGLWVLFWAFWFRLPKIGRLHKIVWPLVIAMMLGTAMLRAPLYGTTIPTHDASFLVPLLLVLKLIAGVLLFAVTYRGFKLQKTEGWMAGCAVLLTFVANYQHELQLIHIPIAFTVLGFSIGLGTVATVTSLLIITVMLLRRFIQAQAIKEQWKLEIEQAQQVQQVLIPHELPEIAGLIIDSEYRPAREVGGDFFQIIPLGEAGSALIVLGDVTGKGVQAGMLVALIVGAIRAAVQHGSNPVAILREVNDQLCERGQAIATCLIMRIEADGAVLIANAGQLPPYLNGAEIEIEGALPLGMIAEAEASTASMILEPGDVLSLMSDGVVEAQNEDHELFGFERVSRLLLRQSSSATIAEAAAQFGQEDDILVLQIHRGLPMIASDPREQLQTIG